MTGTHGGEVDEATLYGVHRRENMVVEGTLVVVYIVGIGSGLIEHLAQSQHVIGVTALGALL